MIAVDIPRRRVAVHPSLTDPKKVYTHLKQLWIDNPFLRQYRFPLMARYDPGPRLDLYQQGGWTVIWSGRTLT
jgi:hypothetical protein